MKDAISYSEAGRLGYLASKKVLEQKYKLIREEYEKNPSVCRQCNKALPYEKRKNKCCNSSCSAKFVNCRRFRKDAVKKKKCLYCDKLTKSLKYCSVKCQKDHACKIHFDRYEQDGYIPVNVEWSVQAFLRRYLMARTEHKCCICGNSVWMGKEIPLIADHIDGNPTNHERNNLRLVCGNCNMQLPTFAGRNYGNGRKSRRVFYKKKRLLLSVVETFCS